MADIYVPNVGETEMLMNILRSQAYQLGLFKNQVQPDGNTIFATMEELTQGGGRGYATKSLSNDIVTNAATANKWYVSVNSSGKAEATYSNAALEWVFNAADVADGITVYGAFAWTLILPFDAGSAEIKVGDTVTGAGGGAATVTAVFLTSGSWGAGAAGWLCIKGQVGVYANDEALAVGGAQKATSNTGANGDSLKKLLFVQALSTGTPIDTAGQKITYTPKITLSTS